MTTDNGNKGEMEEPDEPRQVEFKIIRVSGVATGVGISGAFGQGIFSESICETLYDTGNDKEDAMQSERWAQIICNALNTYYSKEP
jgi:hypothetical protein